LEKVEVKEENKTKKKIKERRKDAYVLKF